MGFRVWSLGPRASGFRDLNLKMVQVDPLGTPDRTDPLGNLQVPF